MIDLRPLLDNGPLYVHCRNLQESEEFWEGVKDQFQSRYWNDTDIDDVIRYADRDFNGNAVYEIGFDKFGSGGKLWASWDGEGYYHENGYTITDFVSLCGPAAIIEPIELESVDLCALFS